MWIVLFVIILFFTFALGYRHGIECEMDMKREDHTVSLILEHMRAVNKRNQHSALSANSQQKPNQLPKGKVINKNTADQQPTININGGGSVVGTNNNGSNNNGNISAYGHTDPLEGGGDGSGSNSGNDEKWANDERTTTTTTNVGQKHSSGLSAKSTLRPYDQRDFVQTLPTYSSSSSSSPSYNIALYHRLMQGMKTEDLVRLNLAMRVAQI